MNRQHLRQFKWLSILFGLTLAATGFSASGYDNQRVAHSTKTVKLNNNQLATYYYYNQGHYPRGNIYIGHYPRKGFNIYVGPKYYPNYYNPYKKVYWSGWNSVYPYGQQCSQRCLVNWNGAIIRCERRCY